ncbi:SDR family NAD(P)-dependent oxidoreductase, partial [Acinetobacter baumannii]
LMSPGPVKSEMSPDALIDAIVCLPTIKYLLDGNGKNQHQFFYWLGYKVPLFPDLDGINWLEGIGNEKIEKVVF